MENIFYKSKNSYSNQLDPVKGYIKQLTTYLSIQYSLSTEEARNKAVAILKSTFKDKQVKFFQREDNGDRTVQDTTLLKYIQSNIQDKNVLAPTFTSYTNASKGKSILAEFIQVNVKRRSKAKKEAQIAKAESNTDLFEFKNSEQSCMKVYNNSLSGIFGQDKAIVHNPTAHSTLTSVTRTMTSLSNATNEKLIAGNRYLPRPIDAFNSIVYTLTYANLDTIESTITKYNMYLPTVEDTVRVLQYSTDLYFNDKEYYRTKIIPFLSKLTSYQLAAIVYTGDLYHIRVYNPSIVHTILTELITPIDPTGVLEDYTTVYSIDESILNFAHTVLYSQVKGYGKDYSKMNTIGLTSAIQNTANNITSTLFKYKDFFNTFFLHEVFPTNSHKLSNCRRRVVIVSDTDSTCFTLDEWVEWYKSEYILDDTSIALAGCISYIASQVIVNSLAIVSKSMNVSEEMIGVLAMKNEFMWSSISPCEVSKHYYALTIIQEGNVFKEPELECKGVHLKNSAVPSHVLSIGKNMMNSILDKVNTNSKVDLIDTLRTISDLEKHIVESVSRGESLYLKKSKIKNKEAYAQDEFKSPYQRHQLWVDVFSNKYGDIQDPPYEVIKIPTIMTTTVKLKEWLDSIEDTELSDRLRNWLLKYNKKDMPTFYLNEEYVLGNGIPKEILSIIDIKRIVLDITLQHRTILSTLGIMLDDTLTVTEQFKL